MWLVLKSVGKLIHPKKGLRCQSSQLGGTLGMSSWEETSVDTRSILKVLHFRCVLKMPHDPLGSARGGGEDSI